MSDSPPKIRVIVLGGGTAGWMTAAALVRWLPHACDVHLIELEEIGIVGVGEATLPHIRYWVEGLGIDEAEFMKVTHATFKLGIEFQRFRLCRRALSAPIRKLRARRSMMCRSTIFGFVFRTPDAAARYGIRRSAT